MVRPLNNPHKIMSIENPKENLADNRGKEKVENFETRASFEGFSDEEKNGYLKMRKKSALGDRFRKDCELEYQDLN